MVYRIGSGNIKMLVPVFLLMTGFGLIVGCGSGNGEQQRAQDQESTATQTFEATLSGSHEVPPVTTDATGSITVTLEGDSIHVQGKFSGLGSEYVGSHIHKGGMKENGGVIQPLDPTVGGDKLSGTFDESHHFTESQISALRAGSLYVNIHSAEVKSGEIRGQITPPGEDM